jgi:hypothetical protein
MQTVSPQKPGGLTALGVLVIIAGALGIIFGLILFAGGGFIQDHFGAFTSGGGTLQLLGFLCVVLAGLDIAVGVSFLNASSWAWTTGIVSQVGSLAIDIYFLTQGLNIEIASIALAVVIIGYLFTPGAQVALRHA